MISRIVLKAALLGVASLQASMASTQQDIQGRWKGPGGEITVALCPASNKFCVTASGGDGSKNSMADIIGKTVVRDIVSDGPQQWKGNYIGDGKNLVATITLEDANTAKMRVCLISWFPYLFCETPTYTRVHQ